MQSRNILLALALDLGALSMLATGCSRAAIAPVHGDDGGSMTAAERREIAREAARVVDAGAAEKLEKFGSSKELGTFLAKVQRENQRSYSAVGGDGMAQESDAPSLSSPAPVQAEKESAKAADGESITNTQEAGVDEGGIVKTHGDHLVVLRRGRLFTVDLARRSLRPISSIDVSPEAGHDAWYDEMLVHDDTIVVVGFSYQVNATEIGLFRIDAAGRLKHKDTFFLRSNDYYSSRNYASRLLGDKLVFYMPYALPSQLDERNPDLPGVMPWQSTKKGSNDWQTIIDATDIYRPIQETTAPVLHTVVTCDLGKSETHCNAKAIVGPYGRSFYVSGEAVYVWVHDGYGAAAAEGEEPPGAVYRFPLDGGDPGALRVWGAPVDQFSFKEGSDGFLNVMVMASSAGDRMWGAEFAGEDVAMLRVPTTTMMHGVQTVNRAAYVDLAEPTGSGYAFQNRFVGDHLLYGRGSSWGEGAQGGASLDVVPIRDARHASKLALPHGVDRIEPLGEAAVVVGTDGTDLHFTSIALGDRPDIADEFVQPRASQGETRSHGFFFKPSGEGDGTLGLPIAGQGRPGYEQLVNGSAEVLFLNVENLGFRKLGGLGSDPNTPQDDRCTVSCVDWYGNARPIFYKGRVFALLGYELVEGDISRGRVREVDRTNMLSTLGRGPGGVVWKDL